MLLFYEYRKPGLCCVIFSVMIWNVEPGTWWTAAEQDLQIEICKGLFTHNAQTVKNVRLNVKQ